MTKNVLGRKGLCPLTRFNHSTSWSKSQGRNSTQKPVGKNWSRGPRNTICCLALHVFPSVLSYSTKIINPGVSLPCPQWSGPSHTSHQSGKLPDLFPLASLVWGHFLNWGFLFPNGSALCQANKAKQNKTNKKNPKTKNSQHFKCFSSICCKIPFSKYYVKILNNNGYKKVILNIP